MKSIEEVNKKIDELEERIDFYIQFSKVQKVVENDLIFEIVRELRQELRKHKLNKIKKNKK